VRQQNNPPRGIHEIASALQSSQSTAFQDAGALGPLRVVNGLSTTDTSSAITTAATENAAINPYEGVPAIGRPGNSTIRWTGGLQAHPEVQESSEMEIMPDESEIPEIPPPRKPITPSLATMEKAVSARIYFENLYFPLFRQKPSREQRRLAMERDMAAMQLSPAEKEALRARWRQNETDYLREKRRKVDVSAFIKLKTIGHGIFLPI
jgi:protein-serine/threonine kinase